MKPRTVIRTPGEKRREPGLYLRVPFGFQGTRVEHFLVDPPVPWVSGRPSDVLLIDTDGATNVFATVPSSRYPYVPDLVEDGRIHGVSVRLPARFNLARLEAERSGLFVAHPRAVALPTFEVPPDAYACPYGRCGLLVPGDDVPCGFHRELARAHQDEARKGLVPADLGALWPLSTLHSVKCVHEVTRLGKDRFRVQTPTVSYETTRPEAWGQGQVAYEPGIVFRFPSLYLEVVSPSGKVPDEVQARANRAGWELWVSRG